MNLLPTSVCKPLQTERKEREHEIDAFYGSKKC